MTTKRREKNPDVKRMFTPRGTLVWPHLNEPDHGTEKYPCSHEWGDYKTKMVLDRSAEGVEEFLAKIDAGLERARELAEEAVAEMPVKARKALEAKGGLQADLPYAEVYDEDTEEPTGNVEMNFKMRAGGLRKRDGKEWTAKPDLFDSRGKPLNAKKVAIYGGTVAIINFDLSPYFVPGTGKYGVSRRLNAVQIIELISSGGSRSASSYGFGTEEGGFDADEYEDDGDDDQDGSAEDGDDEDDDPDF